MSPLLAWLEVGSSCPQPHLVWENHKSSTLKPMEGERPKLPWEEGPQAEGPHPLSVGAEEVSDLRAPMGCPRS